jgi:hypothetical protein
MGVHPAIIRKFYTCPEMWWNEVDGNADLEYTVEVMKEVGEVPPFFARWLMKLAKAIDDRYEKEGRLKGIARLKRAQEALQAVHGGGEVVSLPRRRGLTSRMVRKPCN